MSDLLRRLRSPWRAAALTVLTTTVMACAGTGQDAAKLAPDAAAGTEVATDEVPPFDPLETKSILDSPDGTWLKDDQGREYWVYEVPKIETFYVWLDEAKTQVNMRPGGRLDIAYHDDRIFGVKIYRDTTPSRASAQATGPSKADLDLVARGYQFPKGAADRLKFERFDRGLPQRGQWRNGFSVGDLDGDGELDIVHAPPRKGGARPAVFLGNGKGQWRPVNYKYDTTLDYGDVAMADFDGDGQLDLAFACHLLGVTVLRNAGDGRFEAWSRGLVLAKPAEARNLPPFSSRTLEARDWNGDGRIDLVVLGEGPRLAVSRDVPNPKAFVEGGKGLKVFLNQGDGSWVEDAGMPASRVFGASLLVDDFDADGHLDAVAGAEIGGWTKLVFRGGEAGTQLLTTQGLRPGALVRGLAAADINGDGLLDVAIAYLSRELGVWRTGIDILMQGKGWSFERQALWSDEGRESLVHALGFGDLDGDGRPDLAAGTAAGSVRVFMGGAKGFVEEASPELEGEWGCQAYRVKLVDLDRDGRDELLANFAGDSGGSEQIFAGSSARRPCPSSGSLRVWKASPPTP